MPDPMLSVVMSVRNGETTLPAAIESILGQSFSDFEFIIVDDGSTDRSAEVVEHYASRDSRIRLLRREGRGLAAALNEGIREARGAWIARMDADDVSAPSRFERQMSVVLQNTDIGVIGSGAWMKSNGGQDLGVWLKSEHHDAMVREMHRTTPFIHPSVIMRKDAFIAAGEYRENLRRAQDAELWSRMASVCKFYNIQEPLIEYKIPERVSLRAIWDTARVRVIIGRRMGRPFSAIRQAAMEVASKLLRLSGMYRSRTSRGKYVSPHE